MAMGFSPSSLRAQRSNPECLSGEILDCFAALAMTEFVVAVAQQINVVIPGRCEASSFDAQLRIRESIPRLGDVARWFPGSRPRRGPE
ncbi:hypothetical protein XH96_05720 [Bradyrhizobium sp. CCBAU 51765]|nr:hypothetical protein XH96_05720 [Bradyrhizobium sp. CCBAU 51765]